MPFPKKSGTTRKPFSRAQSHVPVRFLFLEKPARFTSYTTGTSFSDIPPGCQSVSSLTSQSCIKWHDIGFRKILVTDGVFQDVDLNEGGKQLLSILAGNTCFRPGTHRQSITFLQGPGSDAVRQVCDLSSQRDKSPHEFFSSILSVIFQHFNMDCSH